MTFSAKFKQQTFKILMFRLLSNKVLLSYSYETYILAQCEWNKWQNGTCSKTCGAGFRNSTRTVKTTGANGRQKCVGSHTIIESCNIQECPGSVSFSGRFKNQISAPNKIIEYYQLKTHFHFSSL